MSHVGLAHAVGMRSGGASTEVYALSDKINVSIPSTFARLVAANGLPSAAAVILSAAAFLAWAIFLIDGYRRASVSWWHWPAAPAQTAAPFRQLFAVEWAGLLIIMTAFVCPPYRIGPGAVPGHDCGRASSAGAKFKSGCCRAISNDSLCDRADFSDRTDGPPLHGHLEHGRRFLLAPFAGLRRAFLRGNKLRPSTADGIKRN